jgi:hypothetical protein
MPLIVQLMGDQPVITESKMWQREVVSKVYPPKNRESRIPTLLRCYHFCGVADLEAWLAL